jgi:hypothetical protein
VDGVVDWEDHRPVGVDQAKAAQVTFGQQLAALEVGQLCQRSSPTSLVPLVTDGEGLRPATRQGPGDAGAFDPTTEPRGASTLVGMFIRYYLELPLPPGRVEEALLGSAPEWLSELAGEAQRRGDVLLAEVGVGPLGGRLGRRVAV